MRKVELLADVPDSSRLEESQLRVLTFNATAFSLEPVRTQQPPRSR